MSAPDLILKIQTTDDRRIFKPGELITGNLSVEATGDWVVGTFNLILLWRTEGRGNTDQAAAEQVVVRKTGERMPSKFSQPFSLRLPPHPVTTFGNLVRLQWWIGLYVRAKRGKEHFFELPIASTFQEKQFEHYFRDADPDYDDEDEDEDVENEDAGE